MLAIEVTGLRKSYGDVEVLKGIDLQVQRGSLLALLGPNGAGKTTTVRILATLLRFDSGTAQVFGHDVVREAHAVRCRVSLTGQFASLDEELTGSENLVLIARLQGYSWAAAKTRATELIGAFGLEEAGNRQVKHYSGGMRRRLDIATSIVVSPDLLFLDEPTTGLDPRSRRHIWEVIRGLRAAGTTVLLTTQYLDEADELADRIVIIDSGTIIADGTPNELKSSIGSGILRIRLSRVEQRPLAGEIVRQTLGTAAQLEGDPAALSARVSGPERLAETIAALSQAEVGLAEFSLGQPSLDEVFLALTGQPVRVETATTEGVAS
ncbi:MAG: ATP-binding cassette domain-containing protein [Trueperaceae bacterium]|nr:MAG: ATP-binding cassette domain-containing protein [Trueperaceae bacterium]